MDRKSKLKNEVIKKVWLNKRNYKFSDFEFKVTDIQKGYGYYKNFFNMLVYNCKVLILRLDVKEYNEEGDERFEFEVKYFNPQTDNDCFSINHIIGVCSEYTRKEDKHNDMGNADILKNQFILRKKNGYYSPVQVWCKGDILDNNYDKHLSYEFATTEYINYIKKIFEIKKMPRAKIKNYFKDYLNKVILLDKLK